MRRRREEFSPENRAESRGALRFLLSMIAAAFVLEVLLIWAASR